ncbi:MAG TPA: hypothetical protein PK263_05890, partial [bacterium]|nr:hypothetical protein [bacterium]
ESTLPSPTLLKSIDLGLHNAAGDLFWLASIQYYGSSAYGPFPKLKNYLILATDLNPRFSYPYAFAALTLPAEKETDAAIALGKKGLEFADQNWRIPYHLAITYHTKRNDRTEAARYFAIAANNADAPDSIRKMAAFYNSNTDNRVVTKQIWQNIADTSTDEVTRQRAEDYVYHFELLDLLEKASTMYKQKTGNYPGSLDDLVGINVISSKPIDPLGVEITFDQNGKIVIE